METTSTLLNNNDNIYNVPSIAPINPPEVIKEDDSSELDIIDKKMQDDIEDIEISIKDAKELSNLMGKAIKSKLQTSLDKNELSGGYANIIFADNFSDIIQAQTRLLGITIDGKCKVASIRKSRYMLLKAKLDGKDSDALSIDNILNGV